MQLGPAGTFFYVTYPSNLLGEISGRTSRTYSSVIPSSPGGMTFVPAGRPRAGELIVGAFTPSRLYRVALVNDGDGFFRPAGSALWADLTSASPHLGSFRFVPTGPWAGDLLVNEYSNHRARLVAIDPATGDPRSPLALTSFVSSIPSPYGIAFDPVTCDLFVSSWSSGQMWQIAGFPRPGPLTANVATLPTAPVARTDFGLHLGAARAGRNYYLLASVSGSSPGLPIGGGVVLPLIPDNVTLALFFAANDPSCRQFFGVADAAGEASASLALAGVPAGLIGARVTFAYASLQPEPFASNAVTLLVVP
jgi:hypothetical protein